MAPDGQSSLALFSRRVVLADRVGPATVLVEDGLIAAVVADACTQGARDLGEDCLIPGLVELHTDHLEPHYQPRPQVRWDPLSAVFAYDAQIAASGITTVFDGLRVGADDEGPPLVDDLWRLSEALEAAEGSGLLRAEHHIHLRCEVPARGVVDEVEAYCARFPVRLLSLMDHTPGQRQFRDEEKLRTYYRGRSSLSETDLDRLFADRRRRAQDLAAPNRAGLVALARRHGAVLASHDDTTAAQVAESRADGVALAEFPTTVEAAQACREAGIAVLMGAPNVVRGGSHSGNVAARDLARRGLLDILSSDYVPLSLIQGAFALADEPAVGGLPGALRTVTRAPALSMGLTDRGEIAAGLRADLVQIARSGSLPVVRRVWRQGQLIA